MSLKDEWKKAGVNIGHAFRDAGKALGVTAKVVIGKEDNNNGEGQKSKTGEAWTKAGHGFADAGKSLGQAGKATVERVEDDIEKEDKKGKKVSVDEENVIDADFKDKEEK